MSTSHRGAGTIALPVAIATEPAQTNAIRQTNDALDLWGLDELDALEEQRPPDRLQSQKSDHQLSGYDAGSTAWAANILESMRPGPLPDAPVADGRDEPSCALADADCTRGEKRDERRREPFVASDASGDGVFRRLDARRSAARSAEAAK